MEQTTVSMNFWNILQLALSTGFLTACFNQGIEGFRAWRKDRTANKRLVKLSALKLAVELESFAIACADAICDNEMFSNSGGSAGARVLKIPRLNNFSDEINWDLLKSSLAARLLMFPNEISIAQGAIDFWYNVDVDCLPGACDNQLGICGYRAWELANDLRSSYGFPSFEPQKTHWDVKDCLKKAHDKAIAQKRADDESHQSA